ncbi:hypothetical protein ACJMK2_013637 [Sinanodonta woodiana]|uniref:Uncharacterized protein n=1 Tax=Sinanodonta woodiana TaxID=1069815 RepID=A0ABD3V1D4_SINWO
MATADPNVPYAETPRCPIGLDKFKTPRQLPCHHSFCQDCPEDCILSKAAKVKEMIEFECPVCRIVFPVCNEGKRRKKWASLFPIDLIVQSMQGKEAEVERPCDSCLSEGVSVTAHGFCRNCGEVMCGSCLKMHQKLKASKDHTVLIIEELTTIAEIFIGFNRSFHCQKHKDENLKLYCRDHKTACCVICVSVHHRNCSQVLDLTKDAFNLLQAMNTPRAIDQIDQLEKTPW